MEQLDRQHQPAIDSAVASGANAAGVIAAGQGGKGWNWAFYEPFVALALANGLPIVAANVGRDEARRVLTPKHPRPDPCLAYLAGSIRLYTTPSALRPGASACSTR